MREKRAPLAKIKSNNFKIINNPKNIFKNKLKSPCAEIFFPYASSSSLEPLRLPASPSCEQNVPEEIQHVFL